MTTAAPLIWEGGRLQTVFGGANSGTNISIPPPSLGGGAAGPVRRGGVGARGGGRPRSRGRVGGRPYVVPTRGSGAGGGADEGVAPPSSTSAAMFSRLSEISAVSAFI